MNSSPLLQIRNLQTYLGSQENPVRAVDGVDLEIYPGETFALLGESGCGKSMAALSMLRLLPPSGRIVGGDVSFAGISLLDLEEREMRGMRGDRVGMIFQEPMTSLNAVLTIGDQIAESIRLHDPESCTDVSARIVELLHAVGIPDPQRRASEYPHQLSGGMKQRVMIAIALAGRPELLIADEPTTALDVTIQAQVLRLLKDLQRQSGMAVLLITHDLGVVAEVADRVAVMYAGQIIETTDHQRFFTEPLHPYSQKLFHSLPGREKHGSNLDVIQGTVPPLNQEFTLCRFLERCDQVVESCSRQLPPWRQTGVRTGVRCLRPDSVQPRSVDPNPSPVQVDSLTPNANKLLEVRDLKVHFPIHQGLFRRIVGHVKAVDGLDLDIPQGRTLALVGESGCGKTTAGKAILQLLRPTSGQVLYGEEELTKLSDFSLRRRRSEMQIIFQDPVASMNPRMLIGDIITEGMRAQGVAGNSDEELLNRVSDLLSQVGLPDDALARYPHEFSGGQRQRICIARALAVNPSFIVCDEPTSALDVSVQAQILNLLKALQDERALAYLFITHNLSVVSYLAHEVAVMYLGRIVERGTVDEVLQAPRHPYTQALLSAVPTIDQHNRREVIRLEGDMPSPANPPTGCHFHPRCRLAMDQCRAAYPDPVRLSDTASVSCFAV